MPPLPTNTPPTLLPTLEALYQLGCGICAEVEQFQPQVVIGLAHSGWMPVAVAQALWAETRAEGFPPALRSNIGQEKHDIYHARFPGAGPAYCCGECCDGNHNRLGHYLAWIAVQEPWLDTLRAQIQAIYPGDPARLLVVDDLFGAYRTCFAALGLLERLYPRAEVQMLAGGKDLTNDFVDAWMLEFTPALAADTTQPADPNRRGRYTTAWHETLKPLITGSEDLTPDSLAWRPLGADSPAIQALDGLAAPETILAAPAWATSVATRYALQRQRGELPALDGVDLIDDPTSPGGHLTIKPIERLFAQAWLNNGLTRQDLAAAFAELPGGLAQGLKEIRHYAYPHGKGRRRVYLPEESAKSWITVYAPPEWLNSQPDHLHTCGFAEIIPGALWAGAHPPDRPESQVAMFTDLLQRGVRCFLDLTEPGELDACWAYTQALSQVSQDLGLPAERISHPLRLRGLPTRMEMCILLQAMRCLLGAGQGVYLHGGHNLEGRAPLALACWLIEQGHPPASALAQVTDTWLQALPYLIQLPLTPAQRRFVLRWKPVS